MFNRLRERIAAARKRALEYARKRNAWRKIIRRRIQQLREAIKRRRERRQVPQYGCDWAWGAVSPAALKVAGKSFACRYLSFDTGKNLSPAEARALSRAGVKVVVVWETTANRALEGYSAGVADARAANHQAIACGKPSKAPIYFAIDFEATGLDVAAYFRGVNSVLGVSRTGAYGGRVALEYLRAHGLIAYLWQTYAWSGGAWIPGAQLRQYQNGVRLDGVEVDLDMATVRDFGGWLVS